MLDLNTIRSLELFKTGLKSSNLILLQTALDNLKGKIYAKGAARIHVFYGHYSSTHPIGVIRKKDNIIKIIQDFIKDNNIKDPIQIDATWIWAEKMLRGEFFGPGSYIQVLPLKKHKPLFSKFLDEEYQINGKQFIPEGTEEIYQEYIKIQSVEQIMLKR